jgi:hypothetical protein
LLFFINCSWGFIGLVSDSGDEKLLLELLYFLSSPTLFMDFNYNKWLFIIFLWFYGGYGSSNIKSSYIKSDLYGLQIDYNCCKLNDSVKFLVKFLNFYFKLSLYLMLFILLYDYEITLLIILISLSLFSILLLILFYFSDYSITLLNV